MLYLLPNGSQTWGFIPPEALVNAGWSLTGNNTNGTEFLGTINNADLIFRTSNQERLRILSTGELAFQSSSYFITFKAGSLSATLNFTYQQAMAQTDRYLQPMVVVI
ncbi:MAG: hypothetical protein N2560_08835 [Ignavibacteria bacterium]|nr:hypothetical protein [Ignavibacteria bacterium]